MPSATETSLPAKAKTSLRLWASFERWNRKLHFYAGLFLLFFTWLFAFSGLILNHPTWSFAESWANRKDTNYEREITAPGPEVNGEPAQAREILRQLGIEGEILWTTTRMDANQFEFQARRPGHFFFIKADLAQRRVTVRHSVVNLWGVIKVLHTFTGVQMDDGGLFVLSSLYMWFELPQKRLPGAIVLGIGSLICGLFCVGLRWLF